MGMFDKPNLYSDKFGEGEIVTLEAMREGDEVVTAYGPTIPVILTVGGEEYSIIGQGILRQVRQMRPGDLPARVKLDRVPTKGGNMVKVLVPESDGDIPV